MSTSTSPSAPHRPRVVTAVLDGIRGALIGIAETVPGISGGTVALMTGVYERILLSAGHVISGVRFAVTDLPRRRGTERIREQFRLVQWSMVIPLLLGMAVALLTAARVMEGLLEEHPAVMRALFFGLVLASLTVPYRLAANASSRRSRPGRWRAGDFALGAVAAAVTLVIVSLPRGELEPTGIVLVVAGAIAMSALVLPGLSGSFLLLTLGIYEPTLSAVNDRNLAYVGTFAAGCLIGVVSIVKVLQWLLENHRRVTLVVLTGVMAGSLRALWPWIDEDNRVLAPAGDVGGTVVALLAGIATVAVILVAEARLAHRAEALDDAELEDPTLADSEPASASRDQSAVDDGARARDSKPPLTP